MQLSGIQNPEHIFKANCKGIIEAFWQLGLISSVDKDALLIGYSPEQAQSSAFAEAKQQIPKYLLQEITEEDALIIQNNATKLAEIVQNEWYIKFTKNTPIYIIQAILVHPEKRGQGILHKLLSPVFDQCSRENRSILLQTHSQTTLSTYEHFGFKRMETLHSDQLNLTCYNMLKKP